jgi:hypothetical protein
MSPDHAHVRSTSRRRSAALVACMAAEALACAGRSGPERDAAADTQNSTPDAAADGAAESSADDASSLDAGPCQPIGITDFALPPYVSAQRSPGACAGFGGDGGLVEAYGAACIGHAATYASCTNFAPGDYALPDGADPAPCYGCLVPPMLPDASRTGAVLPGTAPVVNYPGCIELLDPTPAGARCAQAVFAALACAAYACQSSCPVSDDVSLRAFLSCTNAAFYGPCSGYALTAEACLAAEQGDGGTPVAQTCFAGATAEDHYRAVAHYFCAAN